jgi:hypothetical protein
VCSLPDSGNKYPLGIETRQGIRNVIAEKGVLGVDEESHL